MNSKELNNLIKFLLSSKIKEEFIIIHSNLIPLRLNKKQTNKFVEVLVGKLKKKFTIIMPSFKFNYKKKEWFYKKTKSEMGSMTEIFRKRYASIRTIHPFHSVCVYGKKSQFIKGKISSSSFDKDSFWSWACNRDDVVNLSLFLGVEGGATFLHYIEEFLNVPYRKFINLRFKSYDKNGDKITHKFMYFGIRRYKSMIIENDWKKVESDLTKSKLLKTKKFGNFFIKYMNTKKVTNYLFYKIKKNSYYMVKKKARLLR